jgi:hypothetical protein
MSEMTLEQVRKAISDKLKREHTAGSHDLRGWYQAIDAHLAATKAQTVALRQIAKMPDEDNEWDAVEKFNKCRDLAYDALTAWPIGTTKVRAWQPMETAPKDGTRILAKWKEHVDITRWCKCYMPDANVADQDDRRMAWFDYDDDGLVRGCYEDMLPTGWMELPQP